MPIKPQRSLKSGGPPPKSPLVSLNIPPKLKLANHSTISDSGPRTATPRVFSSPAPEIPKQNGSHSVPSSTPLAIRAKPKGRPPKPTKPTHVPKGQIGGMSLNDLRASRSALKKIKMNKHARWFQQPVDPIRDHAPRYSYFALFYKQAAHAMFT